MKIMLWCGYQNPRWNKATWLEKGLGGSEYCVLKLAENLSELGHDVTISGDVIEGTFKGVKYVHYDNFNKYQGPFNDLNPNASLKIYRHYDVVIASNYINYFKHLQNCNIEFDKSYFWVHNEYFYPWYKGNMLPNKGFDYLKDKKFNSMVGVSKYHIPILENMLKINNQLLPTINSIDNAIDLKDWSAIKTLDNKIEGQIIWSSSPDRGLDLLLNGWKELKKKRPDLTLKICCPPYSEDWFKQNQLVNDLEGVEWLGAQPPYKLRALIAQSEYWIYSSEYNETYCISALEMMAGRVKILTNGTGNIKNLVKDGRGILITQGLDIERIGDILLKDIEDKAFAYKWAKRVETAYEWVKEQSWENRAKEWEKLIL